MDPKKKRQRSQVPDEEEAKKEVEAVEEPEKEYT